MSELLFKKEDVARVLAQLKPTDDVLIVGDQGVYIISFAAEAKGREIAYAIGCHPDIDSFEAWWETKRENFGGDDGADSIGNAQSVGRILAQAKAHIVIKMSPTQMEVTHD